LARGVDILVATPGRLLDLTDSRSLALSSVQILVLDEADRMLDLGFVRALRRIVKLLPRPRQTLLFSATMPRTIAALAGDYLDNPVKVNVAPRAAPAERIDQGVIFVASDRKRDLLATMLRDPALVRVLVFTRTKHGADRVVRHLAATGIEAAAIHSNKSQPRRERALAGFRDGQPRVLVATNIAARGIDVEGVSHVINFELPNVPEAYVHRIGRTARAGATGVAIALCSEEERPYLRDIEKPTRSRLRLIPAPAAFVRSGPFQHPAEASPPRKSAHQQAAESHRPKSGRRPRQAVGANVRREEAVPAGSVPAFLSRPPANRADRSGRQLGRRNTRAARFHGAR
jgi:ATP-dependent RNA helicase RhlE